MILFLQLPFPGIILDVLPYFVVILLIADHMVIVRALKKFGAIEIDLCIDLLCHLIF